MKIKFHCSFLRLALLTLCALHSALSTARAQGTAFLYQGQLNSNGIPVTGLYDFEFSLSNAPSGGAQVGSTITQTAIGVTNGLFTTTLDFGAVFTGNNTWLAISVCSNGLGNYTPLTPLQELTPTPYAIFATTASNLSGTVPASQLTSIGNTNGANLDNFFVGPSGNTTTSGLFNTGMGYLALMENAGGNDNTANGAFALELNSSGYNNTAFGSGALSRNTSGVNNTSTGVDALQVNTTGSNNTAFGGGALLNNFVGAENTAIGMSAFSGLTAGSSNIALGFGAGDNLHGGGNNIIEIGNEGVNGDNNIIRIGNTQSNAFIAGTLCGDGGGLTNLNASQLVSIGNPSVPFQDNSGNFYVGPAGNAAGAGFDNTGIGNEALSAITLGIDNTANGAGVLADNTIGSYNTASGFLAMEFNPMGSFNSAYGVGALQLLGLNGAGGSNNIAIGYNAGYNFVGSECSNIDIGNQGVSGENKVIRIGTNQSAAYISGIYGASLPGGQGATPVFVDSSGQLGTTGANTSYTPTIGDGTHNFSTSTQTGYYTQVGNVVYFEVWLRWTGKGSATSTSSVEISLPLAVASQRVVFTPGYMTGISFGSQLSLGANNGASYLLLYSLSNSGTAPSNVDVSGCSTTGELQISGVYRWQ